MANPRDESFFARLTRLFRSGPSIRRKIKGYDDTGYYDKRAAQALTSLGGPVGLPLKRNYADYSMMGAGDIVQRMVRYAEYASMEGTPIVSKAMDIIADEVCAGDEGGTNLHVHSDNPQIKAILEDLFYDILNVDFELRVWVRNLVKYGDCFLYREVAPGVGIVNARVIAVNEIKREEGMNQDDPYAVRFTWDGYGKKYLENWQVSHFRILGNDLFFPHGTSLLEPARKTWRIYCMMIDAMQVYRMIRCLHGDSLVWTESGTKKISEICVGEKVWSFDTKSGVPTLAKVTDFVNNGKQQIWLTKSKHRSIKTNFNHPVLVKDKETDKVDYVQVDKLVPGRHQLTFVTEDRTSSGYEEVLSIEPTEEFSDVFDIRVENENHNFIANGLVVHNSPERRVFYIDVGAVAPNDIPNYMNTIMSTIKGSMATDPATGRMDERYGAVAVDDDYIVPVRGSNSGTKIETLAGGKHMTDTEDIELIQSQLFAALGVPKAFLGFDESLSSKATLAQIDIRFSKTIQVLQKIIISELNNLAILHLYALGFDGLDLVDFELKLSNPSTIALQQKLDLWKTKIDIFTAVDQAETKFLPTELLYKEVFQFTDNQIKWAKEKLKADKRFAAELDAITEPLPENQNTVDTFDPSRYQTTSSASGDNKSQGKEGEEGNQPPSGENAELMSASSSDNSTPPVKDNPTVRTDKRNAARRKGGLEKLSTHPDFRSMLNPSTNVALRDIYDTEFLKKPLSEEIKEKLNISSSRKTVLSRQMLSVLETFDRSTTLTKPPGSGTSQAIIDGLTILTEEQEPSSLGDLGLELKPDDDSGENEEETIS